MHLGHELRYPLRDVKRFLFDLSKLLKSSAVLMASQTNIQAGHPGKSYLARDSILVLFLSVFSYDSLSLPELLQFHPCCMVEQECQCNSHIHTVVLSHRHLLVSDMCALIPTA
jgi:hypothetical protein